MVKKIIVGALVCIAFACAAQTQTDTSKKEVSTDVVTKDDTATEASAWLVQSIDRYFTLEELGTLDDVRKSISTTAYYAYKTDAMQVGLDVEDSLSEEEFHEKWKGKFDTSKAGIGVGFLISGQDWDKIEVEECSVISTIAQGVWFDVVLKDITLQENYSSKILVDVQQGKFAIADVQQ